MIRLSNECGRCEYDAFSIPVLHVYIEWQSLLLELRIFPKSNRTLIIFNGKTAIIILIQLFSRWISKSKIIDMQTDDSTRNLVRTWRLLSLCKEKKIGSFKLNCAIDFCHIDVHRPKRFFLFGIDSKFHYMYSSKSADRPKRKNKIIWYRPKKQPLLFSYIFININIRLEFDKWSFLVLKIKQNALGNWRTHINHVRLFKKFNGQLCFCCFILKCLFISLIYIWFGWNDEMSYDVDNWPKSTQYIHSAMMNYSWPTKIPTNNFSFFFI